MRYIELAAAPAHGDFTRNGGRLLLRSRSTVDIWRRQHDDTDVYVGVFERTMPVLYAPLYAPLYFELDHVGQQAGWLPALSDVRDAAVRVLTTLVDDLQVPGESIGLSFSGSKGFHVTVSPSVFGIAPDRHLNLRIGWVAREVARRAKADAYLDNVYDARRVLRLPNSINSKGTRLGGRTIYKVALSAQEMTQKSIKEILRLATQRRRWPRRMAQPTPIPAAAELYQEAIRAVEAEASSRRDVAEARLEDLETLRGTPPCMAYLLQNDVPQGYRNNALFQLALFLHRRKGLTAEQIIEEVGTFGGLDSNEIGATVKSATRSQYRIGCREPRSRLNELIEDGVTVCDRDRCPILEGF